MMASASAKASARDECGAPQVHVFDEAQSGSGEIPLDTVTDAHFRQFVNAISNRVRAAAGCDYPDAELIFLRRPLVAPGKVAANGLPAVPSIAGDAAHSSSGSRRLDTPWVKLALTSAPKPSLRAAFIWNERQFLLDQALLAGAASAEGGNPIPFTQDVFARFAQAYADTQIMPAPAQKGPQAEAAGKSPPADLLWLFRHAWQSTRGPFSGFARSAMNETVAQVAEPYTAMVGELVDYFMVSSAQAEKFQDILALESVVPLGRYKVDKLR